jgi:hypothetical protein
MMSSFFKPDFTIDRDESQPGGAENFQEVGPVGIEPTTEGL